MDGDMMEISKERESEREREEECEGERRISLISKHILSSLAVIRGDEREGERQREGGRETRLWYA